MSDLQNVIDAACRKLELTVKDMGINLSIDRENVASLEEVLLAVKQIGDKEALSGASFMVGAYLGEIVRSLCGGQWVSAAEEGASPGIVFRDNIIYPIEKARRFVKSPKTEGLGFYVDTLAAGAAR